MKRILITGANGLLGQKLVTLLNNKPNIYTIATGKGEFRGNTIFNKGHYAKLDVTDPNDVNRVLGKEKPHIVIHTAAMTNVDECETDKAGCDKLNVEAVKHLVKACNTYYTFLVHLSTDFIFDGESGPYTEMGKPNPLSYYGNSKLLAEKFIQENSRDWAIARTVLVYGITPSMSRSNIILWVKKSLEDGKTIQVVTDQLRSPTLAEDLAYGCYLIADKQAKGIFNISGGDMLTPYEMAIATANFFKLDKSLIKQADSSNFQQTAKRPPRTGFIIEKAQRELGYQPHSFMEGIAILARQIELEPSK